MKITNCLFAAAVALCLSGMAAANLLDYGDFEDSASLGSVPSGSTPWVVGSAVWLNEVMGQWTPSDIYVGGRSSDGSGGACVNIRKPKHSYTQVIDGSAIAPNMPLELSADFKFTPEASEGAIVYVRAMAVNTASAGQGDTLLTPADASSAAKLMAGSELANWVDLANLRVPVAGTTRDQWFTVTTDFVYPGGWDYVFVVFSFIDGVYGDKYFIDNVELNEPEIFAYAGADFETVDSDDNGSETVTLDGSGSVSLNGTITSYSWTEGTAEIATGATPSVDLAVGVHDITLTVIDSNGATASDDIQIEIIYGGPRPPVADAGAELIRLADENGDGIEEAFLDAGGSSDPDSTIVSWVWTENGSLIAMGETVYKTFSVGVHEITLTVTDDTSLTDTDTIIVNVRSVPDIIGNEISEFKSGISIELEGVNGLDYLVENWYHDPAVDPRCTVYIRGDVPINFFHNDMNIVHGEIAGASAPGKIRYRADRDLLFGVAYTEGDGTPYPEWVDGTSLADLQFATGSPLIGSTGPLPGGDITDKGNFYWRGMNDEFGDEWHILTVWDDEYDSSVYYDDWCSDGKIYYYVVNPTTPCISFSKASEDAQWYTRPAKAYFVPVIRPQTSYLCGELDIELAALEAAPVQYSLRVEGDSVDIWQDYTAPINTLTAGLQDATNYELRYRIGTDGPIKTRVICYNPAYPSDAEDHPQDLFWKGEQGLQRIRDRINDPSPERVLYRDAYDNICTNSWLNRRGRDTLMDGFRGNGSSAPMNAFPLLIDGFDSNMAMAEHAYKSMLDSKLNLDPIGLEGNHNRALPCKEMCYQGYYSVGIATGLAFGYDWLIKDMRAGSHEWGFTAVEDYKMRDMLAGFALHTLERYGLTEQSKMSAEGHDLGMWSTAWLFGTNLISAILPEYNTAIYGSSGAPKGNSGPAGLWAPYPDYPNTWWNVCTDRYAPLYGYPNQRIRSGYWGLLNDVPQWYDRAPYFHGALMGKLYYEHINFRANYDGYHHEHIEQAYMLAADGLLENLKSPEEGPISEATCLVINHNFPVLAAKVEPMLEAGIAFSDHTIEESVSGWFLKSLLMYEDDWASLVEPDVIPGDANEDGTVNLDDFIILKQNYGTADGATWSQGDFTGEGAVNLDDFIILKQNYGQ